jgi:16S rRNA processing protein RimM
LTDSKLVFIGTVTRPHGVRGEVKVLEGSGSSRAWQGAARVWIGPEEHSAICYRVTGTKRAGRFAVLTLEPLADREAAENLRGLKLYVERASLPSIEEDEYYAQDLIGMRVVDSGGRPMGELIEIFDNGAQDIYVVVGDRGEILVPVIEGVVRQVDTRNKVVVVDPPDGLPGWSD